MKLFSLIKIAKGWFGDTRNFIRLLKSKGVKIKRKGKFKNNSIYIGGEDFSNPIIKIPKKAKNPINLLFHEGGHALTVPKFKSFGDNQLVSLKRERMANATALQHITDPKDRKAYINILKNEAKTKNKGYGIYKENLKIDEANRLYNKTLKIRETKQPNKKIKEITKNVIEKNKMNEVSTINPTLNKKPWVR